MMSSLRVAAGGAAFLVSILMAPGAAAQMTQPADAMPPAQAREVVARTIELVETKGVYPRRQAEYDQAKAALLATVGGAQTDRAAVYAGIRKLLSTLDADGHSFLMTPVQQQQQQAAGKASDQARASAFALVPTSHGSVLRWTPPAVVGGAEVFRHYLHRFHDEAERAGMENACALVVDLSAQTGGNAWPPFIAMGPLLSEANRGRWVERDGRRMPLVNRADLDGMAPMYAPGRANPLTAFVQGPLAVVVSGHTASAGEMLLVALLGEERVRTFGQASYGLSTANTPYTLADGSTLVLTGMRYALGDGPIYRGRIPPMQPGEKNDTVDASVKAAAEWAAANTPACSAAPRVAAQARAQP